MKAIQVERTGGPEVLQLEDVAPIEEPGPGQAVVRVVAAGSISWTSGSGGEVIRGRCPSRQEPKEPAWWSPSVKASPR